MFVLPIENDDYSIIAFNFELSCVNFITIRTLPYKAKNRKEYNFSYIRTLYVKGTTYNITIHISATVGIILTFYRTSIAKSIEYT